MTEANEMRKGALYMMNHTAAQTTDMNVCSLRHIVEYLLEHPTHILMAGLIVGDGNIIKMINSDTPNVNRLVALSIVEMAGRIAAAIDSTNK